MPARRDPSRPGGQALAVDQREFTFADEYRFDRSSPARWIVSHVLRYKPFALGFLVCMVAVAGLGSAIPWIVGIAFDAALGDDPDRDRLALAALAVLGVALLRGLADFGNLACAEMLGKRLERDAREELYVSLLGKSQTFHNRQRVGDIMARATNDVRQLNPMIDPGVELITESIIGIVVPLIFIALLDAATAPGAAGSSSIAFVFALRRYMQRLGPVSGEMRGRVRRDERRAERDGHRHRGGQVRRAGERRNGQVRPSARPATATPSSSRARSKRATCRRSSSAIATAVAFLHGAWLLSEGVISIGELVAYMGMMALLRFPAHISIFTFALVQLGVAGAGAHPEYHGRGTELDENDGGHAATDRGRDRLRERQLWLRPGWAGAARRLLPRRAGRDGRDRRPDRLGQDDADQAGQPHLRRQRGPGAGRRGRRPRLEPGVAALASLDDRAGRLPLLPHDRREHRLQPGRARRPGGRSKRAARAAQAHEFIMQLREGYDTVIGERGVTLSGGQRQRIAIARALLTDPRILILDDSTSAIDSATEDEIQQAIRRVLRGRTTLLITHRLSQIRWADRDHRPAPRRTGRPGHARANCWNAARSIGASSRTMSRRRSLWLGARARG